MQACEEGAWTSAVWSGLGRAGGCNAIRPSELGSMVDLSGTQLPHASPCSGLTTPAPSALVAPAPRLQTSRPLRAPVAAPPSRAGPPNPGAAVVRGPRGDRQPLPLHGRLPQRLVQALSGEEPMEPLRRSSDGVPLSRSAASALCDPMVTHCPPSRCEEMGSRWSSRAPDTEGLVLRPWPRCVSPAGDK